MHPRPQPTTGAEAFARMLDGVADVRAGEVPDREDRPELVARGHALGHVEVPAPRPEFSASLRARLLEADPAPLREPEPPVAEVAAAVIDLAAARKRKATRRAYTAAAVGSMVLGTAGIAAAAQSALPGSPLYGVKRAIEGVELSFATNDNARGQDLLDQARTRLSEVKALSAEGSSASNTQLIQQTLQAFASSASEGTNLLFTNYQRQGNAGDLSVIQRFASAAANQLNSMAPSVIDQNRAQMLEASSLIANVEQQSKLLCPTCAALPPLNEKYQKLSASQSSSAGLSALLAAPAPKVEVKAPVTSQRRASTSTTASQPTRSTTTPTTPSKPPVEPPTNPTTPATTAVGKTLTAVTKPVTTTLTSVLQVTTNTLTGVTNTVGGLLGGLTGSK
ncbi:MAG: DUF5667 domain-containing protein [Marmoricola sp.]